MRVRYPSVAMPHLVPLARAALAALILAASALPCSARAAPGDPDADVERPHGPRRGRRDRGGPRGRAGARAALLREPPADAAPRHGPAGAPLVAVARAPGARSLVALVLGSILGCATRRRPRAPRLAHADDLGRRAPRPHRRAAQRAVGASPSWPPSPLARAPGRRRDRARAPPPRGDLPRGVLGGAPLGEPRLRGRRGVALGARNPSLAGFLPVARKIAKVGVLARDRRRRGPERARLPGREPPRRRSASAASRSRSPRRRRSRTSSARCPIGVDQPFRVGDYVKIEDFRGRHRRDHRVALDAHSARSTAPSSRSRTAGSPTCAPRRSRVRDRHPLLREPRARLRDDGRAAARGPRARRGAPRADIRRICPEGVGVRFTALAESALNVEVACWFAHRGLEPVHRHPPGAAPRVHRHRRAGRRVVRVPDAHRAPRPRGGGGGVARDAPRPR